VSLAIIDLVSMYQLSEKCTMDHWSTDEIFKMLELAIVSWLETFFSTTFVVFGFPSTPQQQFQSPHLTKRQYIP
jgi:hypothetical protein